MAGLFNISSKKVLKMLDPGAGSGILSAALVELLQLYSELIFEIELTCCENNQDVLELLKANIE
jgi:adenine-specific DNA-methyltransferase